MNMDVKRNARLDWMLDLITQRRERRAVTLRKAFDRIRRKDVKLPPASLEPLSPVDVDDARIAAYESEIVAALQTPEVRNIAVTGGYGAGKSSLIRSFVSRHREYRYAHISLASFENDAAGLTQKSEDAIESTIVQQLLYSVSTRDVPGTRLRRISHLKARSVWLRTLLASIAIICYLRLLEPWPKYLPDLSSAFEWLPAIIAKVGIAAAIAIGIYSVFRAMSSLRVRELSFQGVKWEGAVSSSVLHKHVDEIIHLFEMVPIDVVIIEDLDRFNDKSPFVRLREINFIINSSQAIRHPIRFLYALGDDIFEADEKTKFFDLIVPVIPVINSENSRDMFMSLLEARIGKDEVRNERVVRLVETIAYYVGDMRQLKQMVNEFQLYRAALGALRVRDVCKELAMVALRCVYPKHYSALLRGEGPIREAFDLYPAWLKEETRSVERKLRNLQSAADAANADAALDASEILRIIWSRMEDDASGGCVGEVNVPGLGRVTKNQFITSPQLLEEMKGSGQAALYRQGQQVGYADLVEIMREGSPSFQARLDAKRREVDPDEAEVRYFEKRLEELSSMTLTDAIADSAFMHSVSEFCGGKNLQLVSYLIRNNFLGVDYPDYIGYFYPGAMSMPDKISLLDLRFGKLLEVDHEFNSPQLVMSKLSVSELGGGVGMIAALVEVLLSDDGAERQLNSRRMNAILSAADANIERADQLVRVISSRGQIAPLVSMLGEVCPEAAIELSVRGSYSSESNISLMLLASVARSVLPGRGQPLSTRICASLSAVEDLEAMVAACNHWGITNWFKLKPARMVSITGNVGREVAIKGMAAQIVAMNAENIRKMLQAVLGVQGVSVTYSSIRSSDSPALDRFVKNDWETFIHAVYSPLERIAEDEGTFIAMVAQSREIEGLVSFVMESVDARVKSIGLLEMSDWRAAMDNDHVQISVANLIEVAVAEGISEEDRLSVGAGLVSALDGGASKDEVEDISKGSFDSLTSLLTHLPEECEPSAARLVVSLGLAEDFLNSGHASERFANEIVRSGLDFTAEALVATGSVSPEIAIALAINHAEQFIDYAAEMDPGADILVGVLSSNHLETPVKLGLLKVVTEAQLLSSKVLALVCAQLLSSVVTPNQMENLYERRRVGAIIRQLDDERDIIDLIASVLICAPWEDVVPFFPLLKVSGFSALLDRPRRIEVPASPENMRLLASLQQRGIVGVPNLKSDCVWVRVRTARIK